MQSQFHLILNLIYTNCFLERVVLYCECSREPYVHTYSPKKTVIRLENIFIFKKQQKMLWRCRIYVHFKIGETFNMKGIHIMRCVLSYTLNCNCHGNGYIYFRWTWYEMWKMMWYLEHFRVAVLKTFIFGQRVGRFHKGFSIWARSFCCAVWLLFTIDWTSVSKL